MNSRSWVEISGIKAQLKEELTINREETYGFLITVIDRDLKNQTLDKIRIKIWGKPTDTIIYNNYLETDANGEPTTTIVGNIIIHK